MFLLAIDNLTTIGIKIGIDGLPLAEGKHLWPIMGQLTERPDLSPFLIGAYEGNKDPENATIFLEDLNNELNSLKTEGVLCTEREIRKPFRVDAFILDSKARAWMCGTVGYTAHDGCGRCEQHGETQNSRVVFSASSGSLRTDDSFKNRTDSAFHKFSYPYGLEHSNVKMISELPLCSMHLLYLGVMRTLERGPTFKLEKSFTDTTKKTKLQSVTQVSSNSKNFEAGSSSLVTQLQETSINCTELQIDMPVLYPDLPIDPSNSFAELETSLKTKTSNIAELQDTQLKMINKAATQYRAEESPMDNSRPTAGNSASETVSMTDMMNVLLEMQKDISFIKKSCARQNLTLNLETKILDLLPIKSMPELMEFENNLLRVDYKEAFANLARKNLKLKAFVDDSILMGYNLNGIHNKDSIQDFAFYKIWKGASAMDEDAFHHFFRKEIRDAKNRENVRLHGMRKAKGDAKDATNAAEKK
ncbi:hypothetical protein DMENIID0001_096240 [Sergentomyia squamirostris]